MIIEVKVTWGGETVGCSQIIDYYELRQARSISVLLKAEFEKLANEFIKQMKLD